MGQERGDHSHRSWRRKWQREGEVKWEAVVGTIGSRWSSVAAAGRWVTTEAIVVALSAGRSELLKEEDE
jgi:hypothetical protein